MEKYVQVGMIKKTIEEDKEKIRKYHRARRRNPDGFDGRNAAMLIVKASMRIRENKIRLQKLQNQD